MPAYLPLQARVELILGDRLQQTLFVEAARIFRIESHIDRLGGNRDFIDTLPGPFEIRAARRNHPELRIVVAFLLLGRELRRNRRIGGHRLPHPLGSAKGGLHRTLILIDGEKPRDEITNEKPGYKTDATSEESESHWGEPRSSLSSFQLARENGNIFS